MSGGGATEGAEALPGPGEGGRPSNPFLELAQGQEEHERTNASHEVRAPAFPGHPGGALPITAGDGEPAAGAVQVAVLGSGAFGTAARATPGARNGPEEEVAMLTRPPETEVLGAVSSSKLSGNLAASSIEEVTFADGDYLMRLPPLQAGWVGHPVQACHSRGGAPGAHLPRFPSVLFRRRPPGPRPRGGPGALVAAPAAPPGPGEGDPRPGGRGPGAVASASSASSGMMRRRE